MSQIKMQLQSYNVIYILFFIVLHNCDVKYPI